MSTPEKASPPAQPTPADVASGPGSAPAAADPKPAPAPVAPRAAFGSSSGIVSTKGAPAAPKPHAPTSAVTPAAAKPAATVAPRLADGAIKTSDGAIKTSDGAIKTINNAIKSGDGAAKPSGITEKLTPGAGAKTPAAGAVAPKPGPVTEKLAPGAAAKTPAAGAVAAKPGLGEKPASSAAAKTPAAGAVAPKPGPVTEKLAPGAAAKSPAAAPAPAPAASIPHALPPRPATHAAAPAGSAVAPFRSAFGSKTSEGGATPTPAMANPPPQIRDLEDPELQATVEAIAKRIPRMTDPEVSLDIPPPADIAPPEERPEGSKDPYIGTTFDHRYKIQKLLGEGGMGFVYLARHKVIDKKVAVKVLRVEMAKDREILDRFLQEAKSASSIGHPHIIDISDFGDLPDGSTYFVMEYLEGQSLGDLMDSTPSLAVERICHIARQMADGLAAAHERGIIHRDLKPDNIFLIHRGSDQDFVKILDFGIAKVTNSPSDTKLTKAGAVFGTPHYMSPEQAAGAPIDHRADIYALGVMLYELASGQLPFNADNFMGILTQHMYKAPVPIRSLVPCPDCPPSLEAVILKCLSKKQEARYQSMEELGADLQRIESGAIPLAVTEMMERSGGFNVPADYFNNNAVTQQSAVLPATPLPTPVKKLSRLVWVAGATAAVGLVTTILVISNIVAGSTPPKTAQTAAPAAVTAPAVTASATASAVVAAPEPKKSVVVIAAMPMSAIGYRDDKPFKLPSSVDVEEGKTVSIEIRAEGYETAKLDLDGKETSKAVELKPIKPGTKGTAKPVGSGKGLKKGPGETVDPWNMKK